jgi:hypothetical protein
MPAREVFAKLVPLFLCTARVQGNQCHRPSYTLGYTNIEEVELDTSVGFAVTASCAPGYRGTPAIYDCYQNSMGRAYGPYDLQGCYAQVYTGRGSSAEDTCTVLGDGKLKCWGSGGDGRLGYGDTQDRGGMEAQMGDNLPAVDLGTAKTAVHVGLGNSHICALLNDKTVKCWGLGDKGQLGYGDVMNRGLGTSAPQYLAAVDLGTCSGLAREAAQVVAGASFTCALLMEGIGSDGDCGNGKVVKCWGSNSNGQLGAGDLANRGDTGGQMGQQLLGIDFGTGRELMPKAHASACRAWKCTLGPHAQHSQRTNPCLTSTALLPLLSRRN